MLALFGDCPEEVREQELPRVDVIWEYNQTVKRKVISYTTNHFERSRGGNTDTPGPMDIICVDRNVEEEVRRRCR